MDEQRQQPALLAASDGGNHGAVPRAVQQLRRGRGRQAGSIGEESRMAHNQQSVPGSTVMQPADSSPQ